MDAYDAQLEKVAQGLQMLPRKLSEENVRFLGSHNHFETFEEEEIIGSNTGKRLSLSGSIVVLDLDFISSNRVEKASVSLSNETQSNSIHSPMSPNNDPSGHILRALNEPRLDAFSNMLSFLSRCDRFSTKNVDCFQSLDLISEAIHLYVHETQSSEFGKLVVNPPNRLGVGFLYNELYSNPYYAYLDIVPGSRPAYCLRNFKSIDNWLDRSTKQWITDLSPPEYEARAELVLTLDPPVVISADLAQKLEASVTNKSPALDERRMSSSFSIRKHPRYVSKDTESDDFDALVGNMLPFQLVEVSQIPLSGPYQIPGILARLRQFSWLNSLVKSVLTGPEITWTNEASDLNIADALELTDQPVHRKRVPLSISLRSPNNNDIIIDISWVISELRMCIKLDKMGATPSVEILPQNPNRLNVVDLNRLLNKGNLALAISYAVSNLGRLRRRSTNTQG